MPPIKGSCCCGAVKFELTEEPSMMGTCHCTRCRKVGASTLVFIKKNTLKWIQGQENIKVFEPSEGYKYHRTFCKTCGTALGEILSTEDSFPISAHTIDSNLSVKNQFHEFVSEKPDWSDIGDDAKQFIEHPEF